jgi:uncharacterized membrane protein YqjE
MGLMFKRRFAKKYFAKVAIFAKKNRLLFAKFAIIRLLVISYWLLVTRYRLSVIGDSLSIIRY